MGVLSPSASVSTVAIEIVSIATNISVSIVTNAAEILINSSGLINFLHIVAASTKVMQKPEFLDAIILVVSGSDSSALANFTNVEELTLSFESASTEVSVDIPQNPPPSFTPPMLSEAEPPSLILDQTS